MTKRVETNNESAFIDPIEPRDAVEEANVSSVVAPPEQEHTPYADQIEINVRRRGDATSTFVAKLMLAGTLTLGSIVSIAGATEQLRDVKCSKVAEVTWDDLFAKKRIQNSSDKGVLALTERQSESYSNHLNNSDSTQEVEKTMQGIFDKWSIDFMVQDQDSAATTINTSVQMLEDLEMMPASFLERFEGGTITLQETGGMVAGYYSKEDSEVVVSTELGGLSQVTDADPGTLTHEILHVVQDSACDNMNGKDNEFREANDGFEYGSDAEDILQAYRDRTVVTPYAGTDDVEDFAETGVELLLARSLNVDNFDIYWDCRTAEQQQIGMCKKALIMVQRLKSVEPNIVSVIANARNRSQ